jgi:hypothetical protein
MSEERDPVTRLGPESGGRGSGSGSGVHLHVWEWGPDEARRPGLPWIGIFLLVFGGLLLLQQLVPEARSIGSVVVLAVGLAFLVKWIVDRGTGSLYAGAIITALATPGLLQVIGIEADGVTTFSLGVAFLFIAAVRFAGSGGWGWQLWLGGLLALLGGVSIASPSLSGLLLPGAVIALGIVIIIRGMGRPPYR